MQFQLYVSSQFYPEWRATVADGTQRKPPPQIRTIVICAALGLQKADLGTLVDVLAVTHSLFHHDMRFGTNDGFAPKAAAHGTPPSHTML